MPATGRGAIIQSSGSWGNSRFHYGGGQGRGILSQPIDMLGPATDGSGETIHWFAAWTRSRHEASVLKQVHEKGLEGFLPTSPRWSRWKDRKKRVNFPLFPGYCFVHVAPEALPLVRKCTGVVAIVSIDGRPAPIPDREIDSVRAFLDSHMEGDPCPLLDTGAMVEVTSGPLRGVVGRLERKGSQARLIIAVGLLGQGIKVAVDAADVKPY